MMDAVKIAGVCHEANAAYCRMLGDDSQPNWEEAPDWQSKSVIEGVVAAMKNPERTPAEGHLAWFDSKAADGWTWGAEKDALFLAMVKALAPLIPVGAGAAAETGPTS